MAFAKPFRMPDFFLISGLFLARVIERDWRTYLDRKVVHFVYFYLLWTAIQFGVKAPLFVQEHGALGTLWLYAQSFVEPFGTLWFIYLLPIFFVTTKLAHSLRIPPLAVWLVCYILLLRYFIPLLGKVPLRRYVDCCDVVTRLFDAAQAAFVVAEWTV